MSGHYSYRIAGGMRMRHTAWQHAVTGKVGLEH